MAKVKREVKEYCSDSVQMGGGYYEEGPYTCGVIWRRVTQASTRGTRPCIFIGITRGAPGVIPPIWDTDE